MLIGYSLFCSAQLKSETTVLSDSSLIYESVEIMPIFPGGIDSLNRSLEKYICYPDKARNARVEGRMKVKCLVDFSGTIVSVRIIEGIGFGCDEAVSESLQKFPKWKPGKHNGNNMNVIVTLPELVFSLTEGIYFSRDTTPKADNLHPKLIEKLSWGNRTDLINNYISLLIEKSVHGITYQTACDDFENKDYHSALRNLNKAIVANPLDISAVLRRSATFYHLGDVYNACRDWRYFFYFTDDSIPDSLNFYKFQCDKSLTDNAEKFKSNGYVVPSESRSLNSVDEICDTPPEFIGGIDSLYNFFSSHASDQIMVNNTFNKRVFVEFTITSKGEIKDPEVLTFTGTPLRNEALKLVNLMPHWSPATKNKNSVSVKYIFPILNYKYKKKIYFKNYNYSYNEGVKLLNDGKFSEAINSLNKAILKDSLDLDAHYNRGICYYKLNNLQSACNDWSIGAFNKDLEALKLIDRFCNGLIILGEDTIASEFFKEDTLTKSSISKSYPAFPGGNSTFNEFINKNFHTPLAYSSVHGQMHISVIITKSGKGVRPQILVGSHYKEINEEALRVIKSMPKCIPGSINDKPIDMETSFTINY